MTIFEHFEKAKADGCEWADAAIRNTHPAILEFNEYENIKEALVGAFNFGETPEGKVFWLSIFAGMFDDLDSAILYVRDRAIRIELTREARAQSPN
jgi:hypothetical protein